MNSSYYFRPIIPISTESSNNTVGTPPTAATSSSNGGGGGHSCQGPSTSSGAGASHFEDAPGSSSSNSNSHMRKSSTLDEFKASLKSPLTVQMMNEDMMAQQQGDSPSTPSSHSTHGGGVHLPQLSKTPTTPSLNSPGTEHHIGILAAVAAAQGSSQGQAGGGRLCLKSVGGTAISPSPLQNIYKKLPYPSGPPQHHLLTLSSSNNNENNFLTTDEEDLDDEEDEEEEEIEEGEPNTSEEDVGGKMLIDHHHRGPGRIPPRPPPRKSSQSSGPTMFPMRSSEDLRAELQHDQLNDGDDEEEDVEDLDDDDFMDEMDDGGGGEVHHNGHGVVGMGKCAGHPRMSTSNGSIRTVGANNIGGGGGGGGQSHTQPTTPESRTVGMGRMPQRTNYFYANSLRSGVSSGAASLSGRIGDPAYGYAQQQGFVYGNTVNRQIFTELDLEGDQSELTEIKNQLSELSKSVEVVEKEVTDVKISVNMMRNEVSLVHQCQDELDELRDSIERIDEDNSRNFRLLNENFQPSSTSKLLDQGLTLFLSFSIFSAVLGMLQFGYNTGVINAPQKDIQKFMKEIYEGRHPYDPSATSADSPSQSLVDIDDTIDKLYSIVVAIFAIGGMLGGFSGGLIANKFGRKGGLLLNNLIGIAGGILMGFTKEFRSYEVLILGRFIIGVNCGLNTSLVPMYVSEVAPINLRGALGTVNQLAVTIGLFIGQVLGIEQLLGTEEGWHLLLGLAVVPAILQMILLPFCPESPRYLLITKEKEEEARKALCKFRASNHVEDDIEEMRAEQRAQMSEASISMLQLIRSSTLRLPLVIAIIMQLSQQLSGINAVFYYSTDLFISLAGLEESHAKFATPGIGLIMVGMTLVSIMLMDRAGRRTLHLYGLGGMFIFSIFITIAILIKEIYNWVSYLAVIFTLSFVVFFAVGPGSIPWMITAELFAQGPRPAAMSLAVLTNWFANFLIGIFFPMLKNALSNYVFLPFSVLLAFFWVFTYKKVPETKNKTFEEISALFRKKGAIVDIPASEKTDVNSYTNERDDETSPIRTDQHPPSGQRAPGYGSNNLPSTSI